MGRYVARLGLGLALGIFAICAASHARAGFGAPPSDWPNTGDGPARHYAGLDRVACEAQLSQRGVSFVHIEEARGVLAPVRLNGPLHGVSFHTGVPSAQRGSSPWEIVDCRPAHALHGF